MHATNSPRRLKFAVATLLTAHASLVGYSALVHAPVMDELAHLAAGLSHWEFANFSLYKVNPPLVRALAALPVLIARPKTDWSRWAERVGGRAEFEVGEDFARANGQRSFWLFTLARWGTIPLSLLGAFVCFLWARDLYGDAAGLAAMTLWCFSPNILAYAAIITPDAGAAALGVAANYLFWKWLRGPNWPRAAAAGAVLGLAELTKTTWLVLFAVWPVVACAWWCGHWRGSNPTVARPEFLRIRLLDFLRVRLPRAGQLLAIMVLGGYIINLGYGFEGTGTRLRDFTFVSRLFTGAEKADARAGRDGNRFAKGWFGAVPVPLPANYVLGIDRQRRDFEFTRRSYLRGHWRDGGWWYYYFYAMAVKVPLGTCVLVALAFIARLRDGSACEAWRDQMVLLAPLAAVLALVSSQTAFSRYMRYVLPIAPYAFIWASGVFRNLRWLPFVGWALPTVPASAPGESGAQGSRPNATPNEPSGPCASRAPGGRCPPYGCGRILTVLGIVALAWSVGSSFWYYPHSMSYFNELAGGPRVGHAHLVDANIDWGQDLLYLKRWLDAHPEATGLRLAYFGDIDPSLAGIKYTLPPKGPLIGEGLAARATRPADLSPGWYAVSVNFLRGYSWRVANGNGGFDFAEQGCYSYFLDIQPTATAGFSIYIYEVGPDALLKEKTTK